MDRETEEQEAERIGRQPPPGMWRDGELVTVEPGAPLPQTKILAPDGTELTPEEAALYVEGEEDVDDVSDLDDPDETP